MVEGQGLCAPPGGLAAGAAPRGEPAAMAALRAALRGYLAAHPRTAAEDRALLAAEGAPLPLRTRMAATVRLAEKEVLEAALLALDRL